VAAFRFQDLATRLPATGNLTPETYNYGITLKQEGLISKLQSLPVANGMIFSFPYCRIDQISTLLKIMSMIIGFQYGIFAVRV
jgi:hypothetical protein